MSNLQQMRVLTLVTDGLCNKQIADRLGVRERTRQDPSRQDFERLKVPTRTQAGVLLRSLEVADPALRMRGWGLQRRSALFPLSNEDSQPIHSINCP